MACTNCDAPRRACPKDMCCVMLLWCVLREATPTVCGVYVVCFIKLASEGGAAARALDIPPPLSARCRGISRFSDIVSTPAPRARAAGLSPPPRAPRAPSAERAVRVPPMSQAPTPCTAEQEAVLGALHWGYALRSRGTFSAAQRASSARRDLSGLSRACRPCARTSRAHVASILHRVRPALADVKDLGVEFRRSALPAQSICWHCVCVCGGGRS